MRREPIEVAPEDTLGEGAERMSAANVGAVIVKDYGRLIGILTARAMLKAMAARVHTSEARVRQWMTEEPVTVDARTSLADAATLMAEGGFHHLPVVDGERPVGMVGLREVVRARTALGAGIGLGL
jgi:CBS domain-containing protein